MVIPKSKEIATVHIVKNKDNKDEVYEKWSDSFNDK